MFSNSEQHANEYKRLQVEYKNKADKYLLKKRDYANQFAHIYAYRLEHMAKLLKETISSKFGSDYPVKKLCDLQEDEPEKCIIIGTLFKHQELKPSVLREISEENQLIPQPPRDNYANENDILFLEDDLQRVRLVGKCDVHFLVTGIVCAVLGYIESNARFNVEELIFYEGGPQKPLPTLKCSPLVLLISGLNHFSHHNHSLSLELLQQWLCGNINSKEDNKDWDAANVVRVIIAGNSVYCSGHGKQNLAYIQKFDSENILNAVQSLDEMLSCWCQSVQIDLMPGEFDPSNFMLPQQPFHKCMFSEGSKFRSFQRVTNPYICEVSNRIILGTSGQNIFDVMRVSKIEDPLEALRLTLKWSHVSPTCPDTLPSYPYTSDEPFIIDECPQVYFSGNHCDFKTDLHKGSDGQVTRLLCVPSFCETQSVALVNLATLECQKLSFKQNVNKTN